MNLANRLTLSRLFISIIYFVIIFFAYKDGVFHTALINCALGLFAIALLTDVLDGYIARRYKMVTNFGRIADPFIDKVLVCGTFVFFVSWAPMQYFMPAWMLVIILGREFLVSALRAFAESKGIAFGSSLWGQHKMTTQSLTIIWALIYWGHLARRPDLLPASAVILKAFIWLTLITTIISGLSYILAFYKLSRQVKQD
ncbi:MAG: CDP-diacylglycerol--glycerol-3-phosphate 3-phosphatidyltransferase [Planctomycetes bacterium]|nr:CDP-diacylglycerol--glycerol-3-phosphate 3-phosphatidyltransferase [Planctomycetota bacterium]